MMDTKCRNFAVLIMFGLAFKTGDCGSSISCYQCNSTDLHDPFQCREHLGDDIDIKPKPCDEVYNAAYCIKHTGRFEGGVGTKRFCSSVDMGNYCNYISQPGDTKEYRSCVFTCSSDGCNSAMSNRLSLLTSIPLLALSFYFLL